MKLQVWNCESLSFFSKHFPGGTLGKNMSSSNFVLRAPVISHSVLMSGFGKAG